MLDNTTRPFDASALLHEDEVSQILKNANDTTRDRSSPVSAPRGDDYIRHSTGPAPGLGHDQAPIAEDAINPSHYRKHPSGIECIEVTRHMNFNIGNAIKYIWRHMDKGDPVENLQKAQWYIDDEIRRLQGMR
jgi:hypothetical protein